MAKLRPLHDRVVIKRAEEKEQMVGGLYIPDTAKEKPQQGKVIAVGDGRILEDGTRVPHRAGERHLRRRRGGHEGAPRVGAETVKEEKKYG